MNVDKRIEYFNWIRDIPYVIGLDGKADYCCSSKAKMLADLLKGLGLKTREIICEFEWSKSPLPQSIRDVPYEKGETHLFLQVLIPETDQWINVDPTWDSAIGLLGFDIAEWDGINETILAVEPVVIYSPEKTIEVSKLHSKQEEIIKHFEYHHEFYTAINKWMDEART